MSQAASEGPESKSRKPRVSRATKGQDAKSKQKISVYVSLESARRLGIHATMTGQDRSAIVDSLIRDHLRDWVVQYRPSSKAAEDLSSESEAQAS
jgi:hypothetical protein